MVLTSLIFSPPSAFLAATSTSSALLTDSAVGEGGVWPIVITPVMSTAAAHAQTAGDLHDHHFSMSRYIDTLQTFMFPDWLAL
jgi:hypothetical protein